MKCESCSLDPRSLSTSSPTISDYHPGDISGSSNVEQLFFIPAKGYKISQITRWSDEGTLNISGLQFVFSPLSSLINWEIQTVMIGDDTGAEETDFVIPDDEHLFKRDVIHHEHISFQIKNASFFYSGSVGNFN